MVPAPALNATALVLDLDGTLVDVTRRHYVCYQRAARLLGGEVLDSDRYFAINRDSPGPRDVLEASGLGGNEQEFLELWLSSIEDPALLTLDVAIPNAVEHVHAIASQGVEVAVVTLRRHRDAALRQISQLGLAAIRVVVESNDRTPDGKASAAREVVDQAPADTIWVGDTEVDIAAAARFGCRAVAVASGLRSRAYLESAGADLVLDDVTELDVRRPQ